MLLTGTSVGAGVAVGAGVLVAVGSGVAVGTGVLVAVGSSVAVGATVGVGVLSCVPPHAAMDNVITAAIATAKNFCFFTFLSSFFYIRRPPQTAFYRNQSIVPAAPFPARRWYGTTRNAFLGIGVLLFLRKQACLLWRLKFIFGVKVLSLRYRFALHLR